MKMTGAIGTLLSCNGDAAASKTCNLPLGVGHLTFEAMTFPLAKGQANVKVTMSLSPLIPAALQTTKTVVTATAKNGGKLFCMEVDSAPGARGSSEALIKAETERLPTVGSWNSMASAFNSLAAMARNLKITWRDCGDASNHVKITSFTPDHITPGQTVALLGTGNLDEAVDGAAYDMKMTGAIGTLLSCSGDAAASKTCNLPLGVGHLTFEAMTFPLAKGQANVKVTMSLSPLIPAALQTTKTVVTATAKNGDKLFCMEVDSAPGMQVVV